MPLLALIPQVSLYQRKSAYSAALYADFRWYNDTWGISASNGKLGYIHTIGDEWIIDVYTRFYSQDKADFYQDLFARPDEFNFMARDKEMSTHSNWSVGMSIAYEWRFSAAAMIKKSSIQFEYDYMNFDYDDFRDVTAEGPVGEEPLFGFTAKVIKVYASIWY